MELREEQKKSFFEEKLSQETTAINKIKSDSKYFFKYANRHRKTCSSPNILIDSNDNLCTDPESVVNALQDQFCSVFTVPKPNHNVFETQSPPSISMPLADFTVTEKEIESAIGEIKSQSACPQNCIPALILKKCKHSLSTPLKMFFQKSFDMGLVPKMYKTQQVIPIFKTSMKNDPKNWRPICITSHIIKVFERVIRSKLVIYFERNNILNPNQHGFRKSRSCITQLISYTTHILENLVDGNEVDAIYLDYSKAFDRIDHEILLQKLKFLQLPDKYLKWIRSFLINRTQFVYHNGASSYHSFVKSGVPQGSVLGPLFFILFINDLPDNILSSKIFTFADDTKIVRPISCSSDCTLLQADLDNIIAWSSRNNMMLNKEKFELISYTSKNKTNKIDVFNELPFNNTFQAYSTGDDDIFPSRVIRDLGIHLNSSLNWDDHINYLSKVGKQLSGWILSVFYSRDSKVLLTLFNSLVRSKMEYGCQIWDPFKINQINALEQVQRYILYKQIPRRKKSQLLGEIEEA